MYNGFAIISAPPSTLARRSTAAGRRRRSKSTRWRRWRASGGASSRRRPPTAPSPSPPASFPCTSRTTIRAGSRAPTTSACRSCRVLCTTPASLTASPLAGLEWQRCGASCRWETSRRCCRIATTYRPTYERPPARTPARRVPTRLVFRGSLHPSACTLRSRPHPRPPAPPPRPHATPGPTPRLVLTGESGGELHMVLATGWRSTSPDDTRARPARSAA